MQFLFQVHNKGHLQCRSVRLQYPTLTWRGACSFCGQGLQPAILALTRGVVSGHQAFKQRWKVATLLSSSTFICQPSVLSHFSRIRHDLHQVCLRFRCRLCSNCLPFSYQLLPISRIIRDAPFTGGPRYLPVRVLCGARY